MYHEIEADMKALEKKQAKQAVETAARKRKRAIYAFLLYATFVGFATLSTAVVGIMLAMANMGIAGFAWVVCFFLLATLVPAGIIVDKWGAWDE